MLGIFNNKLKPALGIDISSKAIKIVELTNHKGQIKLKNLGYAKVPENSIVDHNIHNISAVSAAISEAITTANIKTKQAVIAIPGSLVISKTIYVDSKLTDEEVFFQINEDLDQYLPASSLGDISLDFYTVADETEQQDKKKIVIVACKQQGIDSRLNACTQAGLDVTTVDVETFAINNLICKQITNHKIANCHVDIGSSSIKFFTIMNNEVVFSRELKFGFMQLIEKIKSTYNLTLDDAEAKYFSQKLPTDYKKNIETPFCISLANQISQLIQLFYSATNELNFDKLFVSGGCCTLPSLQSSLKHKLNKPIITVNPLNHIEQMAKLNSELLKRASIFTVAYGLSLRSIINDKH
jgi:type IV pilus assembly protein PilM